MIVLGKVVVGLLAAGAVGTAGIVALSPSTPTETATVTRVIDGDTVDVSSNGQVERIRLLNIDTPETKDPSQPAVSSPPRSCARSRVE
jgi:micrococcal nuclease